LANFSPTFLPQPAANPPLGKVECLDDKLFGTFCKILLAKVSDKCYFCIIIID
jgi:hypothetical protein